MSDIEQIKDGQPATTGGKPLLNTNDVVRVRVNHEALNQLSGAQKALLLLVSLDEYVATRVLSHLEDEQVRNLRQSSENTGEAPPDAITAVHHDFLRRVQGGMPASLKGSGAYLRRIAGNALGEGRATDLWSDKPKSEGAAAMANLETSVLFALLKEEQPQTVAVVLSQIPPQKAAEIVDLMEVEQRQNVLHRLAKLESVTENVIKDIERAFATHVRSLGRIKRREITGQKTAADIIKRLSGELTDDFIEKLRADDPVLADEIEKALFTFEDLIAVDSRGMQQLLKEIPTDQLVVALKTASEELKEKVFGNVSRRAADLLHEELELLGPVRLGDVQEAQQAIVVTALDLEREGRIAIVREGAGDYV